MVLREACPQCGSTWFKRNGHIHTGKQNHRGKLCGRAFVLNPENPVITEAQRALIERLLLERISLRGICRAVGVGLQWLLQFMVAQFQAAPEHLYVEPPGGPPAVILQRLAVELDELWSFVGKKENRYWVWVAMDATTRQVIAFHVGDRSGQSAAALREKIPPVYQERALFYTDHL
jgi:insertion element IS1 protein InsB